MLSIKAVSSFYCSAPLDSKPSYQVTMEICVYVIVEVFIHTLHTHLRYDKGIHTCYIYFIQKKEEEKRVVITCIK